MPSDQLCGLAGASLLLPAFLTTMLSRRGLLLQPHWPASLTSYSANAALISSARLLYSDAEG
jgi:hypothetical protein